MTNANALIGNTKDDNGKYCLAKAGELYLVYLPNGGSTDLDLSAAKGSFILMWFNPRAGGALQPANTTINSGTKPTLTAPGADDWLAVVQKK